MLSQWGPGQNTNRSRNYVYFETVKHVLWNDFVSFCANQNVVIDAKLALYIFQGKASAPSCPCLWAPMAVSIAHATITSLLLTTARKIPSVSDTSSTEDRNKSDLCKAVVECASLLYIFILGLSTYKQSILEKSSRVY